MELIDCVCSKKGLRLSPLCPLPKINIQNRQWWLPYPANWEIIRVSRERKYISYFKANAGWFQVEIDEDSKEKTDFVTHRGIFRYTQMPPKFKNAVETFLRAMNAIIAMVSWR